MSPPIHPHHYAPTTHPHTHIHPLTSTKPYPPEPLPLRTTLPHPEHTPTSPLVLTHTYSHIHIHTQTHIHTRTLTQTLHIQTHTPTPTPTHTHTSTHKHIQTYIQIGSKACIHAFMPKTKWSHALPHFCATKEHPLIGPAAFMPNLTNCYHRPSLQCHLLDTQVQKDPPNGIVICGRNTCTAIWADGNTFRITSVPFQDCLALPCGQVPHPVHSSLQELQSCF